MGTIVTLSLEENNKRHFKPAFEILNEVENSLSSYKKSSQISLLNKNKRATLDSYSYEALCLGLEYAKITDGYFNVAIGSITKDLYRFGEDERVPSRDELRRSDTSLNSLAFNKKEAHIDARVKIDLGGMGKGFGVDKVSDYLKEKSVSYAVIALSGDIRCLGSCTINVQNPFSDEPFAEFETLKEEMGVSTSGNYNRYVKQMKNNHLINPKTKESQDNFISITLISELKSSDLDAYATAVSVMPRKQAYKFLDGLNIAYIILERDRKLVVSENIKEYVKDLVINDAIKNKPKRIEN
ncbi:FAD:protein FMN transferase [Sulfurimonas aquatica]|uniref:FAD:protein FMN transferase n=2 Tax=Sulfurimonas aquatica TaxID=2672570 RepID=A0A975B2U7_9BACT|nr:FAD:protein FMN transferase [Sulfurimonas aquatica]